MEQRFIPAYDGKEPFIFVSYAHLDSPAVLEIISRLFDGKYRLWYDEGIAPGSEWPHNIAQHLADSDTALIFLSANSLRSPNCENEVASAVHGQKNIIEVSLDGSRHPLLADCAAISDAAQLADALPVRCVGDGVSGYSREIVKARSHSLWNLLIAAAVLLSACFGTLLYGLNGGWFDSYLGIDDTASAVSAQAPVEEDRVDVGQGLLEQALLQQSDKGYLLDAVEFSSPQAETNFKYCIGWPPEEPVTYADLTRIDTASLELHGVAGAELALVPYLPSLERLYLNDCSLTSLSPLTACAKLTEVVLKKDTLPVDIPQGARFTVCFER
ncbi:MAG: TIR domain-containing protein [Oscillospiraceae bacterium]|nr:TIR domain-containing protein [Oscillospiraceae bacterium]